MLAGSCYFDEVPEGPDGILLAQRGFCNIVSWISHQSLGRQAEDK